MNNVTLTLENEFKSFAVNLQWVMQEAADINKAYFATDASALVSGLANSTDGASLDTKLTKAQYVNYITFLGQIANFFGNAAVSTGDYLSTIDQVIYGNAAAPAKLSDATESLANRIKVHAQSCLTHFLTAKKLLDIYNNSELTVVVSGCTGARMVFGANMDVTELTQGITLVEQFKKLINNEAVATSLYSANVAIWISL